MFKKSGGFGGGKKFGGSRPSYGDERPAMHPATCSKCGNSCEVPFKPNGKKPVFCRDCFHKEEGGESNFDRPRSFGGDKPAYRSTPRAGNDDVSKQLKALNDKMDQILEALMGLSDEDEDEDEDGEEGGEA